MNILVLAITIGVLFSLILLRSPSEQKPQNDLNPYKLAYSYYDGYYKAAVYDLSTDQKLELKTEGIGYVTRFLWSEDGEKLAVLAQGEYDPQYSLKLVRKVFATTQGFNYLIYSVDLETGELNLLHDKLFGEVRWVKDSSGLYFTEQYYNGKPLPLGNQSGHKPTQELYFFLDLKGNINKVSREEFENNSFIPPHPSNTSPNGKLRVREEDKVVVDNKGTVITKITTDLPTWSPQ
jgi:hypothetical protein